MEEKPGPMDLFYDDSKSQAEDLSLDFRENPRDGNRSRTELRFASV